MNVKQNSINIVLGAVASLCPLIAQLGAQPQGPAYPEHAKASPEVAARGKAIYSTNCAFCHGADARGGEEGGPNLIRSDYLLRDRSGEVLAGVVQNGIPGTGMPKFTLSSAEISDIAAFIHDFLLSSRDPGRMRPATIMVGDAKAGESYFKSKCASCHSVTGDLKGLGGRAPDPRVLQQTWMMPQVSGPRGGGGIATTTAALNVPPVTVTVTLPDGKKVNGRLGRVDDFIVTLSDADGLARSFRRDGDAPKVEIHDPMQPHKALLSVYTDKDIHDVTAYLVTVK